MARPIMRACGLIRRFRSSEGATAIEYAIAFPLVVFFAMALLEFCLIAWGNLMIDNVLVQTAREGMLGCLRNESTGTGGCREGFSVDPVTLRRAIVKRSAGFVRACNADLFTLEASPYAGYTVPEQPQATIDLGGSGELVVYRITYHWPIFSPILRLPGLFGDYVRYQTFTVVRNEPFGPHGGVRSLRWSNDPC